MFRWNEQCSWLRLIDFHAGIPFRCASTFLLKFSPFYPLALKKRTILNRIKNRLAICRISLIYKRIFCPIMWFVQSWFFTENKILLLFIDLMPFLETNLIFQTRKCSMKKSFDKFLNLLIHFINRFELFFKSYIFGRVWDITRGVEFFLTSKLPLIFSIPVRGKLREK